METQFIKLLVIFAVIMVLVLLKRSLFESILAAMAVTVLLFGIPLVTAGEIAFRSLYEWNTVMLIINFTMIIFLQRIMEYRKLLTRAEMALMRLSGNRRLVCMAAPIVIGFLPSAGAVNICGEIVNDVIGDDLSVPEKTFVTSYYRHISESISPTYNAIVLALSLTAVKTTSFVILMLPMVVALLVLGYVFSLRKIDRRFPQTQEPFDRKEEWKQLLYCFWPLIAGIILVIALNQTVLHVMPFIILASFVVYRLKAGEILQLAARSIGKRIISNTIVLMIFKNLLTYTGAMETLPALFMKTALPPFAAFGLVMLFGTIISGSTAMIVLIIPLAFSVIPGAGAPLLMFLTALSYAAMQISPTHLCLAVVTEYFRVSWWDLVKKTLPVITIFILILHLYYVILVR